MADNDKNSVPLEGPGNSSGISRGIEIAKRVGIVLGLIAALVVSLPAQGIAIPAAVLTIAHAVLGVLASLGLASSGLHRAPPPSPPQDSLK